MLFWHGAYYCDCLVSVLCKKQMSIHFINALAHKGYRLFYIARKRIDVLVILTYIFKSKYGTAHSVRYCTGRGANARRNVLFVTEWTVFDLNHLSKHFKI